VARKEKENMQRTIAAVALVAIASLISVPATAQTRGLGVLAGTITAEDGGDPVPGVLIKLPLKDGSAVEAKTDDSGKWNMSGVGKGEFHMIVYKEGWAAKTVKLVIEKETMRPEPIKLTIKKGA
jgi:hypothetical protein